MGTDTIKPLFSKRFLDGSIVKVRNDLLMV
jgi:hypothetical protein